MCEGCFICVDVCVCKGVCIGIWGLYTWMYVCVEVYAQVGGYTHGWMDVCVEVYAQVCV